MTKTSITAEQARQAFSYDPSTGIITRLVASSNRATIGPVCGRDNGDGYGRVSFMGQRVYLHRLAWLLHYGNWPSNQVDHINGSKADNSINNLRDVGYLENAQNIRKPKTGNQYLGVSWDASRQKYVAQISFGSRGTAKTIHLGRYSTPEQARAAYLQAKAKYHPHAMIGA